MSQFLFNWIFLVSIELVFFFFYWPGFLKQLSGPETDEMFQFLGPETDPYHQFLRPEMILTHFWAQKSLKWVSIVSVPRN
jgi:hypothetical protein